MTEKLFEVRASSMGARRLDVAGELDLLASSEIGAVLDEYVEAGGDLVVDLSAVTFIDSTGLSVLARAHRELTASGARLIVVRPSTVALRVLHLAGLFSLLCTDGSGK